MEINTTYHINVFTGKEAKGNQTCVVFLDRLDDDEFLDTVAQDLNMPATTFLKHLGGNRFQVRWISPEGEINLCGHGSLGAAWLLINYFNVEHTEFVYEGGSIKAEKNDEGRIYCDFARIAIEETPIPDHVKEGFHNQAKAYFTSENKHVVVFENEQVIKDMQPDWDALRKSETFSYAITAPFKGSDHYDICSRVLLPYISFLEDQATGSAHVVLTEFWANKLDKSIIHAFQASQRGGEMTCELTNDSVRLAANCRLFAKGELC